MDDGALPTVLLPYQRAWIADQRAGQGLGEVAADRRDLVRGGRRRARRRGAKRHGLVVSRLQQGHGAGVYRDGGRLGGSGGAGRRGDRGSRGGRCDARLLAYRLRFASGHKIVALSSRPSNLRGKQGAAIIDEAAFHDDLAGLLKAALAFTMWGGCVRVISTHNGADSAFNELVTDMRAGRRPYSLHRITLEEAVTQGLIRRSLSGLKREWSPEHDEAAWARAGGFLRRQRGRGAALHPARVGGRVPLLGADRGADGIRGSGHSMGDAGGVCRAPGRCAPRRDRGVLEDHLQPLRTARSDASDLLRRGLRTARRSDRDLAAANRARPKRRTPFVVELRNIPFRQQEQILFYIADRLPRFLGGAMDARGNGQYLAETARQRYGARIAQVMLSSSGIGSRCRASRRRSRTAPSSSARRRPARRPSHAADGKRRRENPGAPDAWRGRP